ncbi:hypothetical protein ACJX0J_006657, partial [Zea mays]
MCRLKLQRATKDLFLTLKATSATAFQLDDDLSLQIAAKPQDLVLLNATALPF